MKMVFDESGFYPLHVLLRIVLGRFACRGSCGRLYGHAVGASRVDQVYRSHSIAKVEVGGR